MLFALVMSMLVNAAETKCTSPQYKSAVRQPPLSNCRLPLHQYWDGSGFSRAWKSQARMSFKPTKSRSMALKRVKVNEFRLFVDGMVVPSITEKPVTSLTAGSEIQCKSKQPSRSLKPGYPHWASLTYPAGSRLVIPTIWPTSSGHCWCMRWLLYVYCRIPGEKDKLSSPKMAGPTTQSHWCSTVHRSNKLHLPFKSL